MRPQFQRLASVAAKPFGLSPRVILASIGPSIVLLIAALVAAYFLIDPAPPRTIHMAVGDDDSAYRYYADRYTKLLAVDGITLDVQPSVGAVEALARLRDPKGTTDIAFVQDGLHDGTETDLLSLGSVNYEPIWVFYRGTLTFDRLSDLVGSKIVVGADGSGTQSFARRLLAASGVTDQNSRFVTVGPKDAAALLASNQADAAFFLGAPESPFIKALLTAPDLKPMSFDQSDAYARRFPFLHALTLPHGSIDLGRDLPRIDVHLLATTSNLVVRDTLHPALVSLLMKAMTRTHDRPSLLSDQHDFPADRDVDFDLSPDATRYYKSGPPFLQRYLPFWLATLADRMILAILPLLAVLVPLVKIVPIIYAWQIKKRIFKWYGELKFLETQVSTASAPEHFDEYMTKLEWIEEQVGNVRIPVSYSDHFYGLREHIDLVRRKIMRLRELVAIPEKAHAA